jgi:hypothetical protein
MVILSLKVRLARPLPLFFSKMVGPAGGTGRPLGDRIFSMLALVVSCTTMSTVAGKSTLPLV